MLLYSVSTVTRLRDEYYYYTHIINSIDSNYINSNYINNNYIQSTVEDDVVVEDPNRYCRANPYLRVFDKATLRHNLTQRMNAWIQELPHHLQRANTTTSTSTSTTSTSNMQQWNHARFFPFAPMFSCPSIDRTCLGGPCSSDTSKIACGLSQLSQSSSPSSSSPLSSPLLQQEAPCIVYSIGGNNHWEFELDVLRTTPCHVHSFDCTGPRDRFQVPTTTTTTTTTTGQVKDNTQRLHFHYTCLGITNQPAMRDMTRCTSRRHVCGETWTLPRIQDTLNHSRIDLFKMDIEGFEWPLLEAWASGQVTKNPNKNATALPRRRQEEEQQQDEEQQQQPFILPMQILVEVHYRTHFRELTPDRSKDWKSATDLVYLQQLLVERLGYITVERDDNPHCRHCTELTLLRARC